MEVVLEYSRQLWQASLLGGRPSNDGTLTLPEIANIWNAVNTEGIISRDGTKRNWPAVRGPIGAMRLSLHRIDWDMVDPFTMRDHDGEKIVLTTTSPALLAIMLRQAVTRALQKKVAAKLAETDPTLVGRRVAADHVIAQLKSDRRLTALDRACYASVVCGAVMTHAKAAELGYLVDDRCPLCGAPRDTIVHRIYKCQHPTVVEAREAVMPSWLIREAERVSDMSSSTLWTTGLLPHPADTWPAPAVDANLVYEWIGSDAPGNDARAPDGRPTVHGSSYLDGSCTTLVFRELRRAASSVVQWAAERQGGWRLQMPIPRPLPQTPQAAEYGARVLVKRFGHPTLGASIASDCANVVKDANAPMKMALSGKKVYAGLMKEVVTDVDWNKRCSVRKVPAHVNPTSVPAGPARDDAIGNDLADALAKATVDMHPRPSPAMVQDLEAALRRSRHIVRTIARVTQCFPAMPRDRMVRPPPSVEGARVAMGNGHRWVFVSGWWRCSDCLKMTLRPVIDGGLAYERCEGARMSMDAGAMVSRGHALARTDGMFPVIFCVRCGAWSTRRAYGLSAACRGRPSPAGQQALARIARGEQPWQGREEEQERRRQRGLRCDTAWPSGAGGFRTGREGAAAKKRREERGREELRGMIAEVRSRQSTVEDRTL